MASVANRLFVDMNLPNAFVPIETHIKLAYNKLERRENQASIDQTYGQLTLAQKVSISELGRFGYQFCFIRGKANKQIAVVTCDDKVATVDSHGAINLEPKIILRR